MSENPIPREARAAVFAAVCVLVGVVGHDAFSPGGIPLWSLAGSTAFLFLAVRPLTSRERGLPSILGAMAAVQLGLHQVFATVQQHAVTAADGMSGSTMAKQSNLPALGTWWCGAKPPTGLENLVADYSPSLLRAAGIPVTHTSTAIMSMPMAMTPGSTHAAAHVMTSGMLAAHIVAALVAVWWLRRGEEAAWSLTRALATRLVLPLGWLNRQASATVPWTPPTTSRAAFDVPDRPGPGVLIRFIVARRGPPLRAAAFC